MLGRADNDRIEALVVVIKLAEIEVLLRLGMPRRRLAEALLIDIHERHDVLAGDIRGVRGPAAARADDGDVELLVRRPALGPLDAAGNPEAGSGGRGLKKLATPDSDCH